MLNVFLDVVDHPDGNIDERPVDFSFAMEMKMKDQSIHPSMADSDFTIRLHELATQLSSFQMETNQYFDRLQDPMLKIHQGIQLHIDQLPWRRSGIDFHRNLQYEAFKCSFRAFTGFQGDTKCSS
ncbi:hypothetical protein KSP40_PGU009667 [Platanthera guangdongensis]|uniref:Uncharacterized protein n=1 Tax=Platanthera guangdongensis TaxID=2320717 RepID=A0ABR2N4M5_9ASPA